MFRGPEAVNVRLAGLEHCLQFTAEENPVNKETVIKMRSYKMTLMRSRVEAKPRVELVEIGPAADLALRRTHLASEELFKSACKQVKNARKAKKVKNIEEDEFGSTLGTVHIKTQDINRLQTRKMKALKVIEKQEKAEKVRKKNIESVFAE